MGKPTPTATLGLMVLASCTGAIGAGGDGTDTGPAPRASTPTTPGAPTTGTTLPPSSGGPTAGVAACGQRRIGVSPLRRLTSAEYDATVKDLLADATAPSQAFPQQPRSGTGTFSSDAAGLTVAPIVIESYMTAAEQLAATAAKSLGTLLGCSPAGAAEESCVRQFLERFGKRAYRRPLAAQEVTDLLALYKTIRTKRDVPRSVEVTLRAILQSPHFLYRLELGSNGPAGTAVQLTPHEIATRLAYGLTGSMPDDMLFAAADAGALKSADQIVAQARRLLGGARAKAVLSRFLGEWMEIDSLPSVDKSTKIYPDFSALKDPMGRETQAFVNHVLWERDGRLDTLLTAPVTFVDAALAKLYGVAGVTGTTLKRVDLDPAQRAGLLTQPSVLSVHGRPDQSDPILRGKLVRTQLLCQTLPNPPGDVMLNVKEPEPGTTTRQRFAQHRADPKCASCHTLIDPVGFGFESYDGIGRFRTSDGSLPVDNEGELTATRDLDGKFRGAPELARKLAGSGEVRDCMTSQSFHFLFGRPAVGDDSCSMAVAGKAFAGSGYDLRELVIGLVQTDAFQYRIAGGAQ
jgi:hypothetical protein